MWLKLLLEPLRGVALVLLWVPIKLTRIVLALMIAALGMGVLQNHGGAGDIIIFAVAALALGLVHVMLPRFHHWLRTAGR